MDFVARFQAFERLPFKQSRPPGAGRLLVASPGLTASPFARAVLLLMAHDQEGAMALMLNKPEPDPEVLNNGREVRFYQGGPVELDRVFVLHNLLDRLPDAQPILPDVLVGGQLADLEALLDEDDTPTNNIRFYRGYAGWGAGQLEDELERHDWMVVPSYHQDVFDPEPNTLWGRAIRRLGQAGAMLSHYPLDAQHN